LLVFLALQPIVIVFS